ncbi:YpdA family putative bacillithiol disulfide reductase [Bacillus sp. NEB1478]|uniref:YpdA family putative bacillithiol disulfide reductase n=1 Tax=Bacillus sp. NEB1478 TaxID=3073816 RepID=UPI002872E501|nr:YpdA family putative bacillithiol disulfide reductase [Bacillus sp. NEB1478]WNB93699.1 YpdA family putative bacillithiol disulfide reductase [Bacillus sp. NEB1478]
MDIDVCIIGGGPCGLAAAIALKEKGLSYCVIEKGNVVNTIYKYPTHQTFFSSSEKLEIGQFPFVHEQRKPNRIHALTYYREVVKRKELMIRTFEKAESVEKDKKGLFIIKTTDRYKNETIYKSRWVIIATGYYDNPNLLNIKGEELPHVYHYFKEGHPFYDLDIAVIGGKNSAIDAALELQKCGARPHVFYRGKDYSPSIKPWVLPDFEACVKAGTIQMSFNAEVEELTKDGLLATISGKKKYYPFHSVFAMIGYHPDHAFLRKIGVSIDSYTGRPIYSPETMETNVDGLFIAGVIAAGNNANEIFIENGRFHGDMIARTIHEREKSR